MLRVLGLALQEVSETKEGAAGDSLRGGTRETLGPDDEELGMLNIVMMEALSH